MTAILFIGGRATAELTYHGVGPATTTGGAAATMDFSGVNFGTVEQGKVVAIPVLWSSDGSSRLITAATIGGVTAQVDQQQFEVAPFARVYAGIISAAVEAASGAVSITFEGSIPNNLEIHSYSIVGLVEYPTIVDADNAQGDTDTDVSLFVQTKAGGVAIFATFARNSGTAYTLTGVTEDYDHAIFTNFRIAGGSYASVSDEAAHEIRSQNANNNGALVAASYR